ncbi:MAG: hypothetical protein Q4F65_14730, partial [Propionibacteriaceae bacterium]|nr:hypothetical protein [Propionibacteriaceae bacterium]
AVTEQTSTPPFDLYRSEESAPEWGVEATQEVPATESWNQPTQVSHPAASHQPSPVQHQPEPVESALARPVASDVAVAAEPSGASRTTVGFIIGLLGTLAIGGAVIVAKLLGLF